MTEQIGFDPPLQLGETPEYREICKLRARIAELETELLKYKHSAPSCEEHNDALMRIKELEEALDHAVRIAENRQTGSWDDLLPYRDILIKGKPE